ncbi:hypothetical protein QUF54_01395 [Candidatus Marithioploca araucensis]|uniref:Uncharacterized protein n=1 Tax=Candidatus Marithioploca araucensis TaxID=70273 RepID=A0ABT7VSJ0_9GAMM|nr:hypothetical protein [Candidatus Marithioploca araucensis]
MESIRGLSFFEEKLKPRILPNLKVWTPRLNLMALKRRMGSFTAPPLIRKKVGFATALPTLHFYISSINQLLEREMAGFAIALPTLHFIH